MLEVCGIQSADQLFDQVPAAARIDHALKIAPGLSEYEIADAFRALGARNATGYASFLGAGVYSHYRPVVVDTIVSRGEFLTSYTPYQSEISQGTLLDDDFRVPDDDLPKLTGMDVANASMYDGSTAVPEAAMMAVRVTRRSRILIARSVHPEYRDRVAKPTRGIWGCRSKKSRTTAAKPASWILATWIASLRQR